MSFITTIDGREFSFTTEEARDQFIAEREAKARLSADLLQAGCPRDAAEQQAGMYAREAVKDYDRAFKSALRWASEGLHKPERPEARVRDPWQVGNGLTLGFDD